MAAHFMAKMEGILESTDVRERPGMSKKATVWRFETLRGLRFGDDQ